MKKYIKIILLLLATLFLKEKNIFAQIDSEKPEAKTELKFSTNTEYRITPIYKTGGYYMIEGSYPHFNLDQSQSGLALQFGLELFRTDLKLGISFKNSFRYDHLYYNTNDGFKGVTPQPGIKESFNAFTTDYHLSIFKLFGSGNTKFRINTGYNLHYRGSDYVTTYLDKNNPGNYITQEKDFYFSSFNLDMGVQWQSFNIMIGTYFVEKFSHKFFFGRIRGGQPHESHIFIPIVRFGYRFDLIK